MEPSLPVVSEEKLSLLLDPTKVVQTAVPSDFNLARNASSAPLLV